jgi:hypothetical protein
VHPSWHRRVVDRTARIHDNKREIIGAGPAQSELEQSLTVVTAVPFRQYFGNLMLFELFGDAISA